MIILTGSRGSAILVNPAHIICAIENGETEGFTKIRLTDGAVANVTQTPAEILALIIQASPR